MTKIGISKRPLPRFWETINVVFGFHNVVLYFNTDIKHHFFILSSTETYLNWTSLSWSPCLSVSTCFWCHTTQHQSEVACRTVCRKSVLSNQRQNGRREYSKYNIALCSGGVTIGFGPTLRSCHSFFTLSHCMMLGRERIELDKLMVMDVMPCVVEEVQSHRITAPMFSPWQCHSHSKCHRTTYNTPQLNGWKHEAIWVLARELLVYLTYNYYKYRAIFTTFEHLNT